MNHTNYTSETIRLDPLTGGTKENERNVHLQSPLTNSNNGNHQKKKVSSFQITSIRPTSRSSNDADLADDSENDTEDTSDILDSSKINTDIEPETASCSEDYSKSEEVFVGASPIITNASQYSISTLIHPSAEDVMMTGRLPQGVTVNVTEGGLALAKANGRLDDLNNWQKRFKIVKISSNEKFRRGRWICFDFNDSPAINASESKSEGIQNSAENTVIIPTSDPNMPGFLQVPVPILSVELAQPLTPIALQYPTNEPFVQGTIPMTSNISFGNNESGLNSDRISEQPHFFQPSAQHLHNYGTHEANIQSYSQAINSSGTQTSHSSMSSQACLPSTGNIPIENLTASQLGSNSIANILVHQEKSIHAPVSSSVVLTAPIISHTISQTTSDSSFSQASSSNKSDSNGSSVQSIPSQLHPQPSLSAAHHLGAQVNTPNQSSNIVVNNPAQNLPTTTSVSSLITGTPVQNIVQGNVFPQAELMQSQGNSSNLGSSGISGFLAQGQSSISVAQILQAQGFGISLSQPSSSQVLSALEAVANRNIDNISSNSTIQAIGEEGESASSTSTVAIDNKIEQAMDLVKSHLMFAVREEVEVLKEKILELMDQISSLECENTLLRQYAPPEALQQIQQAQPQSGVPQITQAPHHGGSS